MFQNTLPDKSLEGYTPAKDGERGSPCRSLLSMDAMGWGSGQMATLFVRRRRRRHRPHLLSFGRGVKTMCFFPGGARVEVLKRPLPRACAQSIDCIIF